MEHYNFDKIYELQKCNEWFKPKHLKMYRDIAFLASYQSSANRRKVGAAILSKNGGVFIGYNGTEKGEDNCCEDENFVTKPNVIHAEDNAVRKMISENVDPCGSIIFLTDSPCINCVRNVIIKYGISAVFYCRRYHDLSPLEFLEDNGVIVQRIDEDYLEYLRRELLFKKGS